MDARSKVAAETASVVPFHCVICVEEFSIKSRPPVVLPCGHTYVCQQCSKRLKRCMECREPLFTTVPIKLSSNCVSSSHNEIVTNNSINCNANKQNIYRSTSGRYSPVTAGMPPTSGSTASITIPLPIPKNVVLIAMMEAAERQVIVQQAESAVVEDGILENRDDLQIVDGDDEEIFDLNKIISSVATLSGPCGTYAVAGPDELVILESDPRKQSFLPKVEEGTEDIAQDDELMQGYSADHEDDEPNEKPASLIDESDASSIEVEVQRTLRKGQTVQVVDFSNGVAKLARGEGYIVCNHMQLRKVGIPADKACVLEGVLDTIKCRGEDLEKALQENQTVEQNLRVQLDVLHAEPPQHPTITEAPVEAASLSAQRKESESMNSLPSVFGEGPSISEFHTPDRFTRIAHQSSSDSILEFGQDGVAVYPPTPTYPCSPNSIDSADIGASRIPQYRYDRSSDEINFVFGCGSSFLGEGEHIREAPPTSGIFAVEQAEGRSRARSGDSTYLHATPSSSFDGVNFRTGMSGHRALLSNHTGRESSYRSSSRLMMSEHRGIGRARGTTTRQSPTSSPYGTSKVSDTVPPNKGIY